MSDEYPEGRIDVEQRGRGGFFIVQIDRRNGEVMTRPEPDTRIQAGDGVLMVTRAEISTINALFHATAEKVRTGRIAF